MRKILFIEEEMNGCRCDDSVGWSPNQHSHESRHEKKKSVSSSKFRSRLELFAGKGRADCVKLKKLESNVLKPEWFEVRDDVNALIFELFVDGFSRLHLVLI